MISGRSQLTSTSTVNNATVAGRPNPARVAPVCDNAATLPTAATTTPPTTIRTPRGRRDRAGPVAWTSPAGAGVAAGTSSDVADSAISCPSTHRPPRRPAQAGVIDRSPRNPRSGPAGTGPRAAVPGRPGPLRTGPLRTGP